MEIALEGSDAAVIEKRLGEMCESLLANPIIEDYRMEVEA